MFGPHGAANSAPPPTKKPSLGRTSFSDEPRFLRTFFSASMVRIALLAIGLSSVMPLNVDYLDPCQCVVGVVVGDGVFYFRVCWLLGCSCCCFRLSLVW